MNALRGVVKLHEMAAFRLWMDVVEERRRYLRLQTMAREARVRFCRPMLARLIQDWQEEALGRSGGMCGALALAFRKCAQ